MDSNRIVAMEWKTPLFSIPDDLNERGGENSAGKGMTMGKIGPGWVTTMLHDGRIHSHYDLYQIGFHSLSRYPLFGLFGAPRAWTIFFADPLGPAIF